MNAWSNIEVSPRDSEIIEIDRLEKTLGNISENVHKIRELITRFEVCHFKYQHHFTYIKKSIQNLEPNITPSQIGVNHISKGESAVGHDKTGKSVVGQRYVNALKKWLGDDSHENSDSFNSKLNKRLTKWLGDKNPDKKRLVRLLIARLTWDWQAFEQYQEGGVYKELEFQVCRMDICHYAFPEHLDILIQGIGRMKPVNNFEGCGSFNTDIKTYVEKQFNLLCEYLKSNSKKNKLEQYEIKLWLAACLAKTLKEQVGLKQSIPQIISQS